MCVCMSTCHICANTYGDQEMMLDPLKLELH